MSDDTTESKIGALVMRKVRLKREESELTLQLKQYREDIQLVSRVLEQSGKNRLRFDSEANLLLFIPDTPDAAERPLAYPTAKTLEATLTRFQTVQTTLAETMQELERLTNSLK